jgi:uncharacterized protein (TIGR03545 family)
MPPGGGPEKVEKITPPERSAGTNFAFGKQKSYPRFWLMKAKISSRGVGGLSDLSGEIRNVTTSPASIGKPMVAELRGSMSDKQIKDVRAEIVIDHTKSVPMEKLTLEAGKYPIQKMLLTKSSDAELTLEKATGSLKFSAEIRGDRVDIQSKNNFSDVHLQSSAKSRLLQDVFKSALPDIKTISLNANAKGTWSDLDVSVSSNMASVLEDKFKKYLKGKLTDSQKKIEGAVKEQIGTDQKQLLSNFKDTDTFFKKKLADRQNQILKLEKDLGKSSTSLEKQQGSLPIPGNLLNKDSLLKGF